MSERLSSVEIEDVLSSIRRLVSDDLRPGAKPAEAAAPAAADTPAATPAATPVAGAGVGKLVLTPAHRIAPEAEAEAGSDSAPSSRATAFQSIRSLRQDEATSMPASAFDAEEDMDLPPAAQGGKHDWFDFAAPEDGAPAPAASDAAMAEERAAPEMTGEDAAEVDWAAPGAPDDVLPGETGRDEGSVLGMPEAEDAEAQAERAGPDLAEDWLIEDATAADPSEEAEMPHPETPSDRAEAAQAAALEPESVEAALDEAALSDDTLPEDEPGAEDWADAAEAEIRRELEQEAETSAFARFDEVDHDERPFDEEMLRDLVRDIIREELQGALGERITRNVRKLVRAEIARALAVRDFE
jgi:hypothetical protein